jgi:hypothetical protein
MIRMLLAMAIVVGAMALVPCGAQARGAPWCAVGSYGPGETRWDCSYWTFEACVPYVIAGMRGFCNENPAYVGPPPKHSARRKHRVIRR